MDAARTAAALAAIGRRCHARGWALGTSGNYSAVVSKKPFRLAISASSLEKRTLKPSGIIQVDERGRAVGRTRLRPSAETLLHLEIVKRRGAGAVLHTHSVWGTMLSDLHGADGFVEIAGYEMLKGLAGVTTHDHRERIPIVENDQDMARLAKVVRGVLEREPRAHGILLRRHGLYTWGATLGEAERHVEIFEFLFEAVGRTLNVRDETKGGGRVSHGSHQDS